MFNLATAWVTSWGERWRILELPCLNANNIQLLGAGYSQHQDLTRVKALKPAGEN